MYLSKTQYIRGLQCHKSLWLLKNKPESKEEPDQNKLAIFATGHQVGDLATNLFPGGTKIEYDASNGYREMLEKTRDLIDQGENVIYEATFREKGILIMADILVRNGEAWDFYEVKSSTGVKPPNEDDVAIQWYVLNSQVTLSRAHIVHVNKNYALSGELDVQQLLTIVDITDTAKALQPGIEKNLAAMAAMLEGSEPAIPIGKQCRNPYECDFRSYCWQQVPYPSVFNLYKLTWERKFKLFHDGLVNYEDLKSMDLTKEQSLQIKTALSGKSHIDKSQVGEFTKQAQYPINFLDFETFSNTVPKYEGQQPSTKIPFQYSLHILHEDGRLEHKEFLADEHSDPRPMLAELLVKDVTGPGTIVAFHQSVEKNVIKSLANEFAEHEEALLGMLDRFVDLIVPFRKLMYYHPEFHGSFSIKSILPAMFPGDAELDYKEGEIQDGRMAMNIYANLASVDDAEEKQKIREILLAYCKLDTLAMVKIWQELERLSH